MTVVGLSIWVRRKSWRRDNYIWQEVLTLGIFLEGVSFLLCMPSQSFLLGRALHTLTGVAHLRDYLGHLCCLAAIACVICAVAYRLLPQTDIERFLVWIEVPGALAAFSMLICLTFSSSTRIEYPPADFLDVPCDFWLKGYWLAYGGTVIYLTGMLIWMLVILRQDKRSRLSSDLFIAAATVGLASIVTIITRALMPSWHIPAESVWGLVSAAVAISSLAAGLSWRRNAHVSSDR